MAIYSPFSREGLWVLNREAAFLLAQIDNRRSLAEVLALAREESETVVLADLKPVLKKLERARIVSKGRFKQADFLKKPDRLGVWLQLTNQCNLRCSYCYVAGNSTQMGPVTARKTIQRILDAARQHNFSKIKFKFAGGEPLLRLSLIISLTVWIRKQAQRRKTETSFVVLTNGILLTSRVARLFKKTGLGVSVSVDGLAEFHNQTRRLVNGRGSFALVKRGIENLKKEKVPFNVSVTITRENLAGIPELTEWLLEKKISFAFNFYRPNSLSSSDLIPDREKLIVCLKKAYRLIKKNYKYWLPPTGGFLDRVIFPRSHLFPCGAGRSYVVVDPAGRITDCQMRLGQPLGSAKNQDLIKTIKKGGLNSGNRKIKKTCQTCRWRFLCAGGCPLIDQIYCRVYQALIPEVLELEAKRIISLYRSQDSQLV